MDQKYFERGAVVSYPVSVPGVTSECLWEISKQLKVFWERIKWSTLFRKEGSDLKYSEIKWEIKSILREK